MGAYMADRPTKNDIMGMGWLIITTKFTSYVNGTVMGKAPSLKYPSCMADFCMVGICIMASEIFTIQQSRDLFLEASGTVKSFDNWPELFQKQWIGNFNLSHEAQESHKAWEKNFWEKVV